MTETQAAKLARFAECLRAKRAEKAKSAGVPVTIKDAAEKLAKAGVSGGLISRTEVYDCKSGHTFEVWEVGQWGTDDARMEVLGQGASLQTALEQWQRRAPRAIWPRFTGAVRR